MHVTLESLASRDSLSMVQVVRKLDSVGCLDLTSANGRILLVVFLSWTVSIVGACTIPDCPTYVFSFLAPCSIPSFVPLGFLELVRTFLLQLHSFVFLCRCHFLNLQLLLFALNQFLEQVLAEYDFFKAASVTRHSLHQVDKGVCHIGPLPV